MKPRSVTLAYVAAAAGVSYQTVSPVLNHSNSVAQKTRQKMQAAMSAMNYVPNHMAQQLAGKNTRTPPDLAGCAERTSPQAVRRAVRRLERRIRLPCDTQPLQPRFARGDSGSEQSDGAMLHQRGLSPPAHISIVGYDDTAESAWYQPPLTTVRQDIRLLGERSVGWLVQNLSAPECPMLLAPFATELIVRETTALRGTFRASAADT